MDNELLVKSIRELCKKNNIAISQLEGELNFGAGLISRWIKSSPSLDKIVDIADYFHVSLDEVVGRNYFGNAFINKLFKDTKSKFIKWSAYNNSFHEPNQYHCEKRSKINGNTFMTASDIEYYTFHFNETSYYSALNGGYISIYGQYDDDRIINPNDIKLFIQPTNDSELIEQEYSYKELYDLWLKVLYSIEECCPDEIKAEEFKNAFVLNKSLTNSNAVLSGGLNNNPDTEIITKWAEDPAVQQFMELYSNPEFQKMQQVMTSPGFQTAVEAAGKIQKHLNWGKK